MARKLYITGDAQGFSELAEEGDITVKVSVKHALIADLADEVSVVSYAKSAGNSTKAAVTQVAERCAGDSKTASQLKESRKITLSGDVDAEFSFDGSTDAATNVKVKKSECAVNDGYGNNIFESYVKKSDFRIVEYEGVPCIEFTNNGKVYRFKGEEV